MKDNRRRILLLLTGLLAVLCHPRSGRLSAQEITVKDCYIVVDDNYAETHPRQDNNGALCALVRVKTNDIQGLSFTNHNQYMGDVITQPGGTYLVYIPTISFKLNFSHADYQPGMIDMSEFGYKKNITGGKTYEVILEAPTKAVSVRNGVSFKVSPYVPGAKVIFDGTPADLPPNGVASFPCDPGTYRYRIEAPMYETETGSVTVTSGAEAISKVLRPSTVPVSFKCNTKATLFVDDMSYGTVPGSLQIPQGQHHIRLSAPGYIDEDAVLDFTPATSQLSYTLAKNKGKQVDVHPIRVYVKCSTSNLYKNNKKVPDWGGSGDYILMMPYSKCRLSDDDGKGAVLKVQNKDMHIRLVAGEIYEDTEAK